MDIKIQEAQNIPNRMNPKRPTPKHMTNCQKSKIDNLLKAARATYV